MNDLAPSEWYPIGEGLGGLLDNPDFWIVERKDILLNEEKKELDAENKSNR